MAEEKFAAESGHWYALDGTPMYTILGKNGKERPTTLRDARKLNLAPSVTTIIKMASAPALEKWKRNQVLLAALTLPRNDGESEEAWLARVEQDWQEIGRKAAERGTDIHAAIELAMQGKQYNPEFADHVRLALDAVASAAGAEAWRAEKSFTHASGYGGKVDLHSANWVIDFKTKDGDVTAAETYLEHAMQLSAYRMGLGLPSNARCGIVFVGRDAPGAKFIEVSQEELMTGLNCFNSLLLFWQAKNRYVPGLTFQLAA